MPYLGFEPTASDTLSVFKYVATSSQTTFTGSDADGATLSYDVGDGSCQVWLNGIKLDRSDITATNGTSVVLSACTTGDIVHIQATKAFIPADVVSASSGGTFASAVTVSGDVTGTTINATGDTSAGDNAAVGYTAAEGLILTGQGSTDDITVKNDADTTVVNVATGATDVEISAGNLLFGTGSKGVYLGVTSATAANLLNDYEEGTWTPGITFETGGATGVVYAHQVGLYTKIGKMVHCSFRLETSNNGSGSNNVTITGLPFTVHNSNSAYGASLVTNYRGNFSADHYPGGYAIKNNTGIYLLNLDPDATGTSALGESDWTDGGALYGSITYRSTT